MNSSISTVKLSKQAGHILPHLNWFPEEVLEIINRFPYHSARVFAAGMDYYLNKKTNITELDCNDPCRFLSSSSYGYTLNIGEFVRFVPARIIGLLLITGSIAEHALIDKLDLKKVLVPGNQLVQSAMAWYNTQNNVLPDLHDKNDSPYLKPSIGNRTDIVVQAIDAGASNLAGLKECYLVAKYYERAYNRANRNDDLLCKKIDGLDYELPPFPDTLEIKKGDKFLFEKRGVRFEKHWPDVLLRDGKYSIVHHLVAIERQTISTPNTSNFDDIRVAESNIFEMASFILCKREGKWGAVYSDGLQYFFLLIIPYVYNTPEDVAREIDDFLGFKNETKWVTWDDYKGLFHSFDKLHEDDADSVGIETPQ